MDENQIIVIKKFDSLIKANIIKTKLDAFGIPCFLTEEHVTHLTTPILSGGIRLHIFAADKERVTLLLEENHLSNANDEQIIECPDCKSKKILGTHTDGIHGRMSNAIASTLLGLTKAYYCLDCGNEFGD